MEILLVLLGICFIALPFPLCLVLLSQRGATQRELQRLSDELRELRTRLESGAPTRVEPTPELPQAPRTDADPAPSPAIIEPIPAAANVDPSQSLGERRDPFGFLRSIGLAPPLDLSGREAGLIQWWAPRIGGLLGVLTVIFISVYVSRGSSPWIRFLELIAFDAAVIGLGAFFWRRQQRFASILVSSGMAMLYVTMIAGYAAGPVLVFKVPLYGVVAQFATVAGIFAVSARLRAPGIARLAMIFGFLSTIFTAYVGYGAGSLAAALALQAAGFCFGHRWKASSLITLSAAGAYAPFFALGGLAMLEPDTALGLSLPIALAFLAATVSGLPLLTLVAKPEGQFSERAWRLITVSNTSLGAAAGYLLFKAAGGHLDHFYGTLALLYLAWAAAFASRGLGAFLFQLFFLKGCGLAALWLASTLTGEMRWFALGIECALVAWSTRQSKSRWSETAFFALSAAALALALLGLSGPRPAFGSMGWWLHMALPFLLAIGAGLQTGSLPLTIPRKLLYSFFGALVGAAFCAFALALPMPEHAAPAVAALAAAAMGLAALPRWVWPAVPASAAAPLILLANIGLWRDPSSPLALLAVASVDVLFAAAASRVAAGRGVARMRLAEAAFLAGALVSLWVFLLHHFGDAEWLALLPPLAAIALKRIRVRALPTLVDTFWILPALDLALEPLRGGGLALGALTCGFYFAAAGSLLWRPRGERPGAVWSRRTNRILAHSLAAAAVVRLGAIERDWFAAELIWLSAAAVFFALWKGHRHRIALAAALGFVALDIIGIAAPTFAANPSDATRWQILAIGAAAAAEALAFASGIGLRPGRRVSAALSTRLVYALGIGSYAAVAAALWRGGAEVIRYFTPAMAVFCLGLVGYGIAAKMKSLRFVALLGFALPLSRLIIYYIR